MSFRFCIKTGSGLQLHHWHSITVWFAFTVVIPLRGIVIKWIIPSYISVETPFLHLFFSFFFTSCWYACWWRQVPSGWHACSPRPRPANTWAAGLVYSSARRKGLLRRKSVSQKQCFCPINRIPSPLLFAGGGWTVVNSPAVAYWSVGLWLF